MVRCCRGSHDHRDHGGTLGHERVVVRLIAALLFDGVTASVVAEH